MSREATPPKKFERSGDAGGYTVHQSRKGYVLAAWSHYCGSRTNYKTLIPFSKLFPAGLDLNAAWNDTTDTGEAIAHAAGQFGRTLRKGWILR